MKRAAAVGLTIAAVSSPAHKGSTARGRPGSSDPLSEVARVMLFTAVAHISARIESPLYFPPNRISIRSLRSCFTERAPASSL